jgi:predicted DCC family thiol-disulfide oxidoreductase YuxK
MADHSVAVLDKSAEDLRTRKIPYRVLYDDQCEICQACVAWLKVLDRDRKTICLPIREDVLASVDSRLKLQDCLRQMHVVTPEGEIRVGWDAVSSLARLCPLTWLIGVLGNVFHSGIWDGYSTDTSPQTDIR